MRESFEEEDAVADSEQPTDETGQATKNGDKDEVNDRGDHENRDAGAEEGGDLDRLVESVDAEAERDTDVAVADLRGVNDFGVAPPGVVESEETVGQDHEPTAKPAEVFGADEAGVDAGKPVDEPIRGEPGDVSAEAEQGEIDGQGPTVGFVLADVGFEDFEDVEALPE